MRVLVTGATGVLGRRLVRPLVDREHVVYGLVRDEADRKTVTARDGIPVLGDVLDRDSLEQALPEVDAIVHAATSVPTAPRPSDADWARNDRVRLEGTKNLLAVASDHVDRFVFPSVVWVARRPDGARFDETAPHNPDRTTQSVADVERYLYERAERDGLRPTILRCGYFYSADSVQTQGMAQGLLSRSLPIVGGGVAGRDDATLSFVHVADAADAFVTAVNDDVTGTYHVVDDQPATFAEFLTAFAERLGAPSPRRVPGWLARFMIGPENTTFLTRSMPTTNERFATETGWQPTYATYRDGIANIVDEWRHTGQLVERDDGYAWSNEGTASS